MKIINFEGIGLSLKIKETIININGISIYWYALIIVSAIIIALFFCEKDSGKYEIDFDKILILMLFILPTSIIFARLYFVVFKLDYYILKPTEVLNIRNGGLAIYGGIIGAVITIILFCKIKKIKVLNMTDYLAPYLALGQSIGRWGNFFNTEAHGIQTNSLLRMGIIENGEYIQVHPTFFYESICTFIIFIILYRKRNKRKYAGQLTYKYFFLYGIARTIIEGMRTDSLMLGNLRVSQLISIVLCLVFGTILFLKKEKKDEI